MRPLWKPYPEVRGGVPEEYDAWRHALLDTLGSYCAYCESPVTNDTAVEHKAAKKEASQKSEGGFPHRQTDWVNLVVACGACNSAKGAHPDVQDARGVAQRGEDLYHAVMNHWAWPDFCPNPPRRQPYQPPKQQAYQLFSYEYSAQSQAMLRQRDLHLPESEEIEHAHFTRATDQLWVIPNERYISGLPQQDSARAKAKRTISTLKLNRHIEGDSKASDRRVRNRTTTYLNAVAALGDLENIVQRADYRLEDPRIKLMVEAITLEALASGFWSVWMFVFQDPLLTPLPETVWWELKNFNAGAGLAILTALFLTYPQGWNGLDASSRTIFPGTDVSEERLGFRPAF